MGAPNETVGIFHVDQTLPQEGDPLAEDFTVQQMAGTQRKAIVILTLETTGLNNRLYVNEEVELRDDATPAEMIELRRRLMMTINRFNKKEAAEA